MKKILFSLVILTFLSNFAYSQWNSSFPMDTDESGVANSKGNDVKTDNSGNCYVTGYTNISLTGNDIILIKYNTQGAYVWSRTFDGSAHQDDNATTFGVDGYGNIYVAGYVNNSNTGNDMVVIKYNSSGTLQWSRVYNIPGVNSDDKALAIAVDNAGNSYVTGYTTDNNGVAGIVTLKYNTSGDLQWDRRDNGNNNLDSKGLGIAVDNAGNTYVTGYSMNAAGNNDIITIEYNTAGSKLWASVYPGSGNGDDQAKSIGVDASGNVFVAGYVTNGTKDFAIIKYNNYGVFQWLSLENGSGNSDDRALGIAVDAVDGAIYVTGYETNSNTSKDYLTVKYNTNGGQVWNCNYNGPGYGDDQANDIALIRVNGITTKVVVTGGSWGSTLTSDYATVKYDAVSGALQQVIRYSFSIISSDDAKGVAVDNANNKIFVTGCSVLLFDGTAEQSYISTQMIQGESSELNTLTEVPSSFNLYQNYPNPFNPSTNIKFDISTSSNVKLAVFDVTGKLISTLINQDMSAGSYNISFNMSSLSSGVYFYELTSGSYRSIKKMTLIK